MADNNGNQSSSREESYLLFFPIQNCVTNCQRKVEFWKTTEFREITREMKVFRVTKLFTVKKISTKVKKRRKDKANRRKSFKNSEKNNKQQITSLLS
jgi:hypothetical protein